MKTHSVKSIKLNRLKIFIGLITALVLALLGYSVYLYRYIDENKTENYLVTEARVTEELTLKSIDNISRYHGTIPYHVVEAITNDQEALLIFVDQSDESAPLIVYSKSDLITDEAILSDWKAETTYREIYQTQYGLRNEIPLLEIIYLDHSERLSYDYYRLDNGVFDSGISFANKSK